MKMIKTILCGVDRKHRTPERCWIVKPTHVFTLPDGTSILFGKNTRTKITVVQED